MHTILLSTNLQTNVRDIVASYKNILSIQSLLIAQFPPSGQVSEVYYSVHPHSHVYRVSVSMCIRNCISYIKITIKIVRVAII